MGGGRYLKENLGAFSSTPKHVSFVVYQIDSVFYDKSAGMVIVNSECHPQSQRNLLHESGSFLINDKKKVLLPNPDSDQLQSR